MEASGKDPSVHFVLFTNSHGVVVFLLLYMAYAGTYFLRTPFSVVKPLLASEITTASMASIDSSFLAAYCVGCFLAGSISQRFGDTTALSMSLAGSALCCGGFALVGLRHMFALNVVWCLNGLFQGVCYPMCVALLMPNLRPQFRGLSLALWTTCQQVGGAASTILLAKVSIGSGWQSAFVQPSFAVGVIGVVVYLTFNQRSSPSDTKSTVRPRSSSYKLAFSEPVILCLSGCYFCVKLVRYTMMFWLPLLLTGVGFELETAAWIATFFNVGGVVGGMACGYCIDRFGVMRVVAIFCMACGSVFVAYGTIVNSQGDSPSWVQHVALVFLVGFFIAGPDSSLGGSATISAMVVAGKQEATVSASAIVSGFGSLGSLVCGFVVSALDGMGMSMLMSVLAGLLCLGGAFILPFYSSLDSSRAKET
eukprot:TRINITY_DN2754_c0_g1_i1.p1 TRINITY_DN2754_c0_g1~~TRINITY_DN2754_c0_g1_i1.p1  ORF type:complete len:446 (-),score=42.19 TRINITY_DN2754_c0_g1_i1:226-1491(-)